MRACSFLVILILAVPAASQEPPPAPSLEARVRALEQEVQRLRAELQRLQDLEVRLKAIELIITAGGDDLSSAAVKAAGGRPATPRELSLEGFPAMPYGDEQIFVVTGIRDEGQVTATGRERRRIEVDLVELPVDRAYRESVVEGYRFLSLPDGFPQGARRFLLVMEDLDPISAEAWADALRPSNAIIEGRALPAYRQVRFARVPTAQTHHKGYEGNSGTIRPWRGQMIWYENNVFFIEDGVLHLRGAAAARVHLLLVKD